MSPSRSPNKSTGATTDPLRRAEHAPPPRTLLDVLAATTAAHPDEPALDDGTTVLTYLELTATAHSLARRLVRRGIGPGARVGVRMPSGSVELYVAILGVLAAGAAYVPVDVDDPDERAELVFGEAAVALVLAGTELDASDVPGTDAEPTAPGLADDAWIIFTSGSTGTPKGVAVNHRSAAAFVDAEARLFCVDAPLGPGDRVLAGLSVAFDASCEEMWLAWGHGAALVPAPRALVRTGTDLGPWLVAREITVVSTVPTLAALWPAEALEAVRLLVFGGEACPEELAARLAVPGREVWNTYGPTEATVVACAARLGGDGPVRIGLPLDGWDLAVLDLDGNPVGEGASGELVIGGVGLARYLDPARDAEKYAPATALGWDRAYRSGDQVRNDAAGLVFVGRLDDQVKLGGRRIELGEVDAALAAAPGVAGAAAAVRGPAGGHQLLVGYVVPGPAYDRDLVRAQLRETLPAALVPLLAEVDALPTRTSGKVDRGALPWPLEQGPTAELDGTAGWVAQRWAGVLGSTPGPDDDFFTHGGGSLAAAQLVAALRARHPGVTVADVYDHPRLGALAEHLDSLRPVEVVTERHVRPVPRRAQVVQVALTLLLQTLVGLRWLTWTALLANTLSAVTGAPWMPTTSWWWVVLGWLLLGTPPGRMGISVLGSRLLLRGVVPGAHPRGGSVHLRLWCCEQLAEASGAANLAGAPWISYYARALGATLGPGVDLHSLPPVTGMLTLGAGASIEPEVDLAGHWLDGDVLHLGRVHVGAGAHVGARSTLLPGAHLGRGAHLSAGSALDATVPPEQTWAGSPAVRTGVARPSWPAARPPRAPGWVPAYGVASAVLGALPLLAASVGLVVVGALVAGADSLGSATTRALLAAPLGALVALVVFAGLVLGGVRALSVGIRAGHHPVRSRTGWQVWATLRLMDDARTWLFPLYSSLATPVWLRLLGARIGRGVEASTVLMLPSLTTVRDGAFLADDTTVGTYELGGGWIRVERTRIGRRAFLGNSGFTGPGRKVPRDGLVAVLAGTPRKAKAGSSWLGSPPVRLRRNAAEVDESRTFAPTPRLRVARSLVELCRVVPVAISVALGLGLVCTLAALADALGWWAAGLLSGVALVVAGALAAGVTVAAKWILVGRFSTVEHPLWSAFVWRDEVADTFVEVLAAPWFARAATGTPVLTAWLRAMGARIGRGVWCETYWLPEGDLVVLGDGASVNRGCVLQTHLFHDRVMSMDTVTLGAGATLGPHSVVLPAASLGPGATVGPASLVVRGDAVPAHTRWRGNPVRPWLSAERSGSRR